MEVLAQRIREIRAERGTAIEKLARELDVSTKTLSGWLKNDGSPNAENLVVLADVLGVTTDYLLGRTDDRSELRSGVGVSSVPADASPELADEVASAGDARRAGRQPRPRRRGASDRTGS